MSVTTGTLDQINQRRGFIRIIPADPALGDYVFASITSSTKGST